MNLYPVAFSKDGQNYSDPIIIFEKEIKLNNEKRIVTIEKNISPVQARYFKFYAKNIGRLPKFHKSAGQKAWIFLDEIFIE